jgi:hypothetical protein
MALTLIKTVGAPDANVYGDDVDAQAYLESVPWGAGYASVASEQTRFSLLIHATRMIDALWPWAGQRASDTQALAFPRANLPRPDSPTGAYYAANEIPPLVRAAQYEQALYLAQQLDTDPALSSILDSAASVSVGPLTLALSPSARAQRVSEREAVAPRARRLLTGLVAPGARSDVFTRIG